MKSITFTVTVDENNEYIGEYDLEIPFDDEMYSKIVALAEECRENGQELSEEFLDEKLPDVTMYIFKYAKDTMSEHIDVEDEEDLDAFMSYVQYPDDLCDEIIED